MHWLAVGKKFLLADGIDRTAAGSSMPWYVMALSDQTVWQWCAAVFLCRLPTTGDAVLRGYQCNTVLQRFKLTGKAALITGRDTCCLSACSAYRQPTWYFGMMPGAAVDLHMQHVMLSPSWAFLPRLHQISDGESDQICMDGLQGNSTNSNNASELD